MTMSNDDGVPLITTKTSAGSARQTLSSLSSSSSTSASMRERGVYSRLSGAIKQGSGFFIPGLKGYRIRLVFGLMVVIFVFANGVLDDGGNSGGGGANRLAVDGGRVMSEALALLTLTNGGGPGLHSKPLDAVTGRVFALHCPGG